MSFLNRRSVFARSTISGTRDRAAQEITPVSSARPVSASSLNTARSCSLIRYDR